VLSPTLSQPEALRIFYRMWTTKEAYTKALGLGLGYDFSRVECKFDERMVAEDVGALHEDIIRVDGAPPNGWEFCRFKLEIGVEDYELIAARAELGSDKACVFHDLETSHIWRVEAGVFMNEATELLTVHE
jgi:4'-phosphopantetheinyl transferase